MISRNYLRNDSFVRISPRSGASSACKTLDSVLRNLLINEPVLRVVPSSKAKEIANVVCSISGTNVLYTGIGKYIGSYEQIRSSSHASRYMKSDFARAQQLLSLLNLEVGFRLSRFHRILPDKRLFLRVSDMSTSIKKILVKLD